MSESLEQLLMKYYSGKLRAEKEMAIYKIKSELFFKELQHTKESLKKEKEKKNFMKEMQNLIKKENDKLYKKIIDQTKTETNSIKDKIETLKENMDEFNRKINLTTEEGPFDNDGTENIWNAARKGSLKGVKFYLVQDPSNLNKIDLLYNCTPLHYASDEGHLEIVKYLLSKSAIVDPKDKFHRTPLMVACYIGHVPIVNLILDKGADINCLDEDRSTPLHAAIAGDHLDIVKLLIQRGADRTIKNNEGMTPLDLAIDFENRRSIVNHLRSF